MEWSIKVLTLDEVEQKEESLAASSSISKTASSFKSFWFFFSCTLNFSLKLFSTESLLRGLQKYIRNAIHFDLKPGQTGRFGCPNPWLSLI